MAVVIHLDMATCSHYRLAIVLMDISHDNIGINGSWASNESKKIIDGGFRAIMVQSNLLRSLSE